jgi:hypothetical protein
MVVKDILDCFKTQVEECFSNTSQVCRADARCNGSALGKMLELPNRHNLYLLPTAKEVEVYFDVLLGWFTKTGLSSVYWTKKEAGGNKGRYGLSVPPTCST